MARLILLILSTSIVFFGTVKAQLRNFSNIYEPEFFAAYSEYPEIPKGLLEAVAYNRTNLRHLDETELESCIGLPQSFGVFGLVEDGNGYFSNTLSLVTELSGNEILAVKSSTSVQILAYAKAISSVPVSGWNGSEIAQRLIHVSELPHENTAQNFALEVQLYEVISLLNNREFMSQLGYPTLRLNLNEIFGSNLDVLSAKRILMDGEHIYNESGETYRAGGGIAPCYDYVADAFVQTPTCNYSSRSGTAISAVTIHTIQGSYAGAISWAQDCSANVSYHYVVSSTGQITQMVCEADKGWHVGTENPYTIGIEHDGYISDPNNYTAAMYATTGDLCFDISQSGYGISGIRTAYFPWAAATNYNATSTPGSCVKIKGHQHFPNQSHTDPGQYWDWHHFYKLVNPNTPTTTLTSASGNFYDSGGQIGVYSSDERTLTLIAPTGASSVSVTFQSFDLEDQWDYLYIYDGTDVFSPMIGYYTGTNNPGTVTSNSGNLLFEFRSDCATANPGWEATWNSNGADNIAPTVEVTAGPWETENFYAFYSENDNIGGSGVVDEERFSSVLDFDGTRWSGNSDRGYLYDNFNPGLSSWVSQLGTWSLNGGTAIQSNETETNSNLHIPVVQEQFFNYLYSYRMKLNGSGANRRAGMHFMCSDATLANRGNSYFIYLRADNDKCQIYKVTNDIWELETDDDFTVDPNTWYDVKVICNHFNGEIRVYVNGVMASSWTDPSPILTGNSISLRTGNCTAEYDDVRVYKGRIGAQYISIGTASDPVRYQNPNPNTPACEIRTIVFDGAGNCSTEDVIQVNIDWTAPALSGVNDGNSTDIDVTNDGTQLFANWAPASDPNSGINHYEVAIGDFAGGTNVHAFSNEGSSTSINVPFALVPNDWYYTTVKAVNGAGLEEADTSNGQQYIDITVGIEEFMRQSVYPNPTTGIVNLPKIDNLKWQLFDATGRLVTEGNREKQIDLRAFGLAKQVYSLSLFDANKVITVPLVYIDK
ncbi:MAG: N-acetylmuramoyl-L-alanine amidase [Flavobacteriales bacterium]|nr:N-acetylmuramoyl-L-alanine amidase [Flavobacteriales bacterium]